MKQLSRQLLDARPQQRVRKFAGSFARRRDGVAAELPWASLPSRAGALSESGETRGVHTAGC
jgi:hypothetical protein